MQSFTRKTSKIVMLLAALALLFVMTACGGGDDTPERPDPTPTPAQGAQATPAPAQTPAPAPAGEPRVITLYGFYMHGLHGALPFEEPDWDAVTDPEMARMQWDNVAAVEERFNVRFQTLTNDDYETFLELFMAGQMMGEPIGDLVLLSGSMMNPAIQAGQLTDLNTLQFPGSDLHGPRHYIVPTAESGGSIWQVNLNIGAPIWSVDSMIVNMDLVDRLGLPDPIALYEAGNWNWTTFLDIMRTAKAQGYFGIAGVLQDIGKNLVGANDGSTTTPDLNYGMDQPNTLAALELFATIVAEGLWHYDVASPGGTNPDDEWGRASNAFNEGESVFGAVRLWMDWSNIENVRAIPFPMGPANRTGNTWMEGMPTGIVIPAGVEDPAFVLEVLEALMGWPGEDYWMLRVGPLDGARGQLQTEGCAERWVNLGAQVAADPGMDIIDYRYMWGSLFDALFNGTMTLAEWIEYERGPRQEVLDRVFR
ncbi:MAG: extracellular solute-binding protein [Defluviitaleaceae bacterium]|nr:extracellular solute-binding protein [Defluviitaleaceae bacterium]MCL2273759.1 extracellular solute-binding protein [Defluviitaleaceae bacterium]